MPELLYREYFESLLSLGSLQAVIFNTIFS